MAKTTIMINRAPVLTLWAAVVAERLGFDSDSALSLGKALAGLNAQTKGRSLGIFKPPAPAAGEKPKRAGLGEEFWIELCGRPIPAKNTSDGVRAVVKDRRVEPDSVRKYLVGAFKSDLDAVREAMRSLASVFPPEDFAERAFGLYERFRPHVAAGRGGWGHMGELDLERIRSLAKQT